MDSVDKIIHLLHLKYSLEKKVVEDIVWSQFKFLKDTFNREDMESVRLPKLGLFCIKSTRKINEIDGAKFEPQVTGDSSGIQEPDIQEQGDRGVSAQEGGNMQPVPIEHERGL